MAPKAAPVETHSEAWFLVDSLSDALFNMSDTYARLPYQGDGDSIAMINLENNTVFVVSAREATLEVK